VRKLLYLSVFFTMLFIFIFPGTVPKVSAAESEPPVVTLTPATTSWTNSPYSLRVKATDNVGVVSLEVLAPGSGTWVTFTGNVTASVNGLYQVRAKDAAGNYGYASYNVSNLDYDGPTLNLNSWGFWKSSEGAPIEWNLSDNTSGPNLVRSLSSGEVQYGGSGTFRVYSPGTYTFKGYDSAGNTVDVPIHIDAGTFDDTPPKYKVVLNPSGYTNGSLEVKVLVWDEQSNIREMDLRGAYYSRGSEYTTGSRGQSVYAETMTFTAYENREFILSAVDSAGNILETPISVNTIDDEPPTVSSSVSPRTPTNKDVTITIYPMDYGVSGLATLTFPNGTKLTSLSDGNAYSYTVNNNGTYNFKVTDKAGNETVETVVISNIDKTPPKVLSMTLQSAGQNPLYAYGDDRFFAVVKFDEPIDPSRGKLKLSIGESDSGFEPYGASPNTYKISGSFYKNSPDTKIAQVTSLTSIFDLAGNEGSYSNIGLTAPGFLQYHAERPKGSDQSVAPGVVVPVIDTIIPEVTNLHLAYTASPTNPTGGSFNYARVGDTVTATFDLSSDYLPRAGDRIVIQGQSVVFTKVSGNRYTAKIILKDLGKGYESIDAKVQQISDLAGNLSDPNAKQRDNSVVEFYTPTSLSVTEFGIKVVTKYPGQRTFSIVISSSQDLETPYTLTATVAGVTKTKLITSKDKTITSFDFDTVADKMKVGDYHPIVKATSWLGERSVTMTSTISFKELYLWDKYDSVLVGGTYKRGPTLIQKNVTGFLGAYPDDGRHTDGYWYVNKGVYVPEPELTLDPGELKYYSEVLGRSAIALTGKVEDSAGEDVTVTASIGGVTKSLKVIGTSNNNPKPFSLIWDVKVDKIAEGTYRDIEVSAKNTTGEQKKISGMIAIVDTTKPTLPQVSLVSSNLNPKFAKQGDQLTLRFTSSENLIKPPLVQLFGRGTSVSSTGTLSYVSMQTLVQDMPEGLVPLIISYEDLAGNVNTTVGTTDGSSVTFYPAAPTIDVVRMRSDLLINSERAIVGSKVFVDLNSTHKWSVAPVIRIAGRATIPTASANSYTSTTVMINADTEGLVPFSISGVVDAAGNIGVPTTDVTTGRKVTFDNTKPSYPTVSISSDNGSTVSEGGVIKLTLVPSEPLVQLPKVTIEGVPAQVTGSPDTKIIATTKSPSLAEGEEVKFSVDETKDLSGLTGDKVTTTTDGSSIKYSSTPASVSKVSISSSSGINAKEGDTVTIVLETSKEVNSLAGQINGEVAISKKTSPTSWTISKKLWEKDPSGRVSFNLSQIKDSSGKLLSSVTSTTDGSYVNLVSTPLAISNISGRTESGSSRVKSGDIVLISFTVNKPMLYDPVVRIGMGSAGYNSSNTLTYTYQYKVSTKDISGQLEYRISNIADLAGKFIPEVIGVIPGITVDNLDPYVESVTILPDITVNTPSKITIIVSEQLKESPVLEVGGVRVPLTKVDSTRYSADVTYRSNMGDFSSTVITISNIIDLAGNKGADYQKTVQVISETAGFDDDIDVTFSGATGGGVYTKSIVPVFFASSRTSQKVVIVSSTLNDISWVSGKPITTPGLYTLKVVASSSKGSITKSIQFEVK
jgi:hypothetical protein